MLAQPENMRTALRDSIVQKSAAGIADALLASSPGKSPILLTPQTVSGHNADPIFLFPEEAGEAGELLLLIQSIRDPEYNATLSDLKVIQPGDVSVERTLLAKKKIIKVRFTPTVKHCAMATTIGLCLRVKLAEYLGDDSVAIDISVHPGTHDNENDIHKQCNDKERVAAALENVQIRDLISRLNNGPS